MAELKLRQPVLLEAEAVEAKALPYAGLAGLLDALPNAVLFLDREWRIVYVNAEARRISQLGPHDLNKKTHWELYPETVGHSLETSYRTVMRTRVAARIEYHYEPFAVWLDISIVPIDEGIALYYQDITARKRADEAREIANRKLQQVLDASPESIVCIAQDWRCSFVNQAAREILKSDDLVGADLWTRFPMNQQEPFASNYRAVMELRDSREFEAYYPQPLDVWFRIVARPFEDGIVIFSSDISDRKRAEAKRDANARQLEQVLEATSDAVLSLDRNWTIRFMNEHGMALVGRRDLVGKNMWEEFPAARYSEVHGHYHRAMDDRIAASFETYYPEPLHKWFSIECRPSEDGIVVFFRDVDEERRAQQELLHQRDTLAFIQEAARVATWEVDLETETIQFTSGSYPVFGRPNDKVLSLDDIRKLVVPEDLAAVLASGERALREPGVTTVDYRVARPDGSIVWLERRCIRVCSPSGVLTHLRGMTTDITQRKQDEERVTASEERYRVLADLNPQSIWMGDATGRIVYANQRFVDYTGIAVSEATGMDWLAAFDPLDRERVIEAWSGCVATGSDYQIEARILRVSDGASRWWFLRALPVRDTAGTIQSWLGVAHDIQEERSAAEELRQKQAETERQRAELETVYRTAPIGLALFDPVEFRYLRLNDRQAEIVGLPPEQILGRTLTEIAPIEGLREMFEQVAAGNPIQEQLLEGELPARPGEHRYWTVNYYPVYRADGTIRAITAASLEITHQKKSELALIQSEKLAAVGRLASSISHEINNPLEAITNLLYLVATDEKLPEEVRVYVHMAQSELARVSQIATQTLRFHRQAMKPTLVTAAELIGTVLNLYRGRLGNSGIRIDWLCASKTPILCFENDIRQVLNNLIGNAIDAMRTGGRLLARAHDGTDWSGGQVRRGVRITIADTGHGMSAAVKARVFEPFYTTKDLNGTGLGLWISAGIVQHHRGRLTVRSSEGADRSGTVFTLFLPLAEDVAAGGSG